MTALGLDPLRVVFDTILIISLIMLGLGYHWKDRRAHLFRASGFLAFGIFWLTAIPDFLAIADTTNALFAGAGLPFYGYMAYHEKLSFDKNEDVESLRWIAGASLYAAGVYLLIDKVPVVSAFLIAVVSYQTVWLLEIAGYSYGVGAVNFAGNNPWYRTNLAEISIAVEGTVPPISLVLACTAFQSMMIFIGAIYCVKADEIRKWKAFLYIIPTIWVLNLARNVGVILMVDQWGVDFETAHNVYGKMGSLLALIILAFVIFRVLPELLDNINGLIDLPKRGKEKGDKGEKPPPDDTDAEGDVSKEDVAKAPAIDPGSEISKQNPDPDKTPLAPGDNPDDS